MSSEKVLGAAEQEKERWRRSFESCAGEFVVMAAGAAAHLLHGFSVISDTEV